MIKQNHFPNVAAVTTLFVVLLGSGMNLAHAKEKPHNKGHVAAHHGAKHVEQRNKIVTDKHSKLSKNTNKPVKLVSNKPYKVTGVASWYGYESGNRTASGERFNPKALTAAHRTLPLSSKVRVTNLKNNKSVIVTINDRGPYHGHRLIDLSLASARAIDMKGIGRVTVEAIN